MHQYSTSVPNWLAAGARRVPEAARGIAVLRAKGEANAKALLYGQIRGCMRIRIDEARKCELAEITNPAHLFGVWPCPPIRCISSYERK